MIEVGLLFGAMILLVIGFGLGMQAMIARLFHPNERTQFLAVFAVLLPVWLFLIVELRNFDVVAATLAAGFSAGLIALWRLLTRTQVYG